MNPACIVALCAGFSWMSGASLMAQEAGGQAGRPSLLLITADDMNGDSPGCYGGPLKGITPNIDALARQGLRFERGHVTIAVCQPCRSVLMTGLYPFHNGAEGFGPIRADVPTLGEALRAAGYLNGILGKVKHLAPRKKFCWDFAVDVGDLGGGRDPALYGRNAREFFELAAQRGRPFFLMANAHDPHRPFAGSRQERRRARRRGGAPYPEPARRFDPAVVPVPGFLPDLPAIRKEVAQYYASVNRCDQVVGAILRALEESGWAERTVVVFLSDHGMAFPFAKTNCYPASTHVPWIVRWPGRVAKGQVDRKHFVAGIDLMPTLLEVAGLKPAAALDGRSFAPLLRGEDQSGRERVFTVFHETAARRRYPMRSIQESHSAYIYNAWADGETIFRNESQSGLSFAAMRAAAEKDKAIAARVELFLKRVPEELYDLRADPDALVNLVAAGEQRDELTRLRGLMLRWMKANADPLLERYRAYLARADRRPAQPAKESPAPPSPAGGRAAKPRQTSEQSSSSTASKEK